MYIAIGVSGKYTFAEDDVAVDVAVSEVVTVNVVVVGALTITKFWFIASSLIPPVEAKPLNKTLSPAEAPCAVAVVTVIVALPEVVATVPVLSAK